MNVCKCITYRRIFIYINYAFCILLLGINYIFVNLILKFLHFLQFKIWWQFVLIIGNNLYYYFKHEMLIFLKFELFIIFLNIKKYSIIKKYIDKSTNRHRKWDCLIISFSNSIRDVLPFNRQCSGYSHLCCFCIYKAE